MGHAHITDFNVAIHYSERRLHTSVAGSMAYMAPEIVGRKGYTWCIDWWSLGVTAYELIFKKRPFEGRSIEKMTASIQKDSLKFPDDASSFCTPDGLHALEGLLQRNPKDRLACKPGGMGIVDFQQHPWFANIDWDSLENKESQPPFVPDVSCSDVTMLPLTETNPHDLQMKKANFDVTHELDEFLMVEKPLTHSKRKANPDLEKMKPELRQLEEQSVFPHFCILRSLLINLCSRFTVYDFTSTKRISYYPHNQPIMNAANGRDSEEPATTLVPTATGGDRSLAGSPIPEVTTTQTQPYVPAMPGMSSH